MYWRQPTADELKGTRHKPTDYVEPVCEVWEEHWDVLALYSTYMTQWRVGAGGVFGLDYNVFHHALDRKGISGDEYDDFVRDLGIIEMAAMAQLNKN